MFNGNELTWAIGDGPGPPTRLSLCRGGSLMDLHSLTWEPPQMPTPGDSTVLSTVPVGSGGLCVHACELGYSMEPGSLWAFPLVPCPPSRSSHIQQ